MEVGLEKCTEDFIRYALYDVDLLEQIVVKQVSQINWICRDILKMDIVFDQQTLPMSQDSLVSKIFINYIYTLPDKSPKFQDFDAKHLLNAAFSKTGLLKGGGTTYRSNLKLHKSIFDGKKFSVAKIFECPNYRMDEKKKGIICRINDQIYFYLIFIFYKKLRTSLNSFES